MRSRRSFSRREYSYADALASAEELSGNADVMIRRRVQFRNRDVFVGGMRDVDRTWTEQQRLSPAGQKRDVGRVRKDRRIETGNGDHLDRRHLEHVLDRDARF